MRVKITGIIVIIAILLSGLSACGSRETGTGQEDGRQAGESLGSTLQTAEEQAGEKNTPVQPEEVNQEIPTADSSSEISSLLGSWVDADSAGWFANITATEDGYQYEDNDGKYAATFADGKLTVQVSDTETAEAYLDGETGRLVLVYQEEALEFVRK